MATKVCPVPADDVERCRAGCAAFLLRERGKEFGGDPNEIAMRLLVTATASPKEREIARALVWLESRVLYSEGRANEPPALSGGRLKLLKLRRRWSLVEVEAPTVQQLALFHEMALVRRRIFRRVRQLERQFARVQKDAERLTTIARQAVSAQCPRVLRVIHSDLGASPDAEGQLTAGDHGVEPNGESEHLVAEGPVRFYEMAAGVLKVFRGMLEPRDARLHYELGLFDLMEPTTLDEWRGARQFLESALSRVGCSPAELEEVLPDGGGSDGARRAAMRLKRSRKDQGAALDFNRWLNALW